MELMDEIKAWIKKEERINESYAPTLMELNRILWKPDPELHGLVYKNYLFYNLNKEGISVNDIFENLVMIPLEKIPEMSREVRKNVRNRILKRLKSIPLNQRGLSACYGQYAQPIQKRLQFVTEGKETNEINWLTNEQQEEIYQKLIALTMIEFDKILLLETANRFEQAKLALDITLLEKKTRNTHVMIIQSEINKMVETEKEREQLKQKIKTWYQNTEQTFVEEVIGKKGHNPKIKVFKQFDYLMDEGQKKRVKELCIAKIEQDFKVFKEEKQLEKIIELEEQLQEILTWANTIIT